MHLLLFAVSTYVCTPLVSNAVIFGYDYCLFYRGNFSDFGIVETGSNSTHIRCTSAHLTSFAVLVDASGVESVSMAYLNT